MHQNDLSALIASGQFVCLIRLRGYGVSSDGQVWSLRRFGRWIPLQPWVGNNGKNKLYVRVDGKGMLLHRLILEGFRGPCPDGLIGCHNDDDPANNHIDNLRWDTKQSNVDDRKDGDRYAVGSEHHMAKLTEDDVRKIRARRAEGVMLKVVGAEFGIDLTTVCDICRRKTWRHVE